MVVSAPRDENELQHLLYTAVKAGQPMAVRYPRGHGDGVDLSPDLRVLETGKGEIIKEGSDLAILAIGSTVTPALNAAKLLAEEGIDAAVANARFAKPLDSDLILGLAQNTGRLITVEENTLKGGFGSAVLELLAQSKIERVTVERIGLPDRFIEHGNPELLKAELDLDTAGIIRRIKSAYPDLLLKQPLIQ